LLLFPVEVADEELEEEENVLIPNIIGEKLF
jgi:hypothetical protein